MSIYNNESKICPDLNPAALQEPQTYWLKKLTKIEAFFLDEIEERRREVKKKKRLNTIIGILETGLTNSAVIAEEPLSQHLPAMPVWPLALPWGGLK